jgi:alkanesulfonate monooxygenase SsuD/methylene tetrahydromethanopterin reductase-like flavin-dependent oxidoreductase (luciferase family)
MEAKFRARENATIDKLIEQGIILCGSPKTVRERILQCQNEMGFGHLLAMLQIGSQPADQSERSMRLFAQEVMPALKAHDDMIAYKHAAE